MKKLFDDTRLMDKAVQEKFGLSDDVMMENAAAALENRLFYYTSRCDAPKILIACGSGDNGGDGYAVSRRIPNCIVWSVLPPKSPSCIRQKERAEKVGVRIFTGDVAAFKREFAFDTVGDRPYDDDSDVFGRFEAVVDCIFGSGFHGEPDESVAEVIRFLNSLKASKIACDVPSCLSCASSSQRDYIFKANVTATMGALKKILYADNSKDYVGEVYCGNLGVTRQVFESLAETSDEQSAQETTQTAPNANSTQSTQFAPAQAIPAEMWLLEKNDFAAPKRKNQCVHKGTYGHGVILIGEKHGAGIIAGEACFAYGAGLVTLVACDGYRKPDSDELSEIPCSPAVMTGTQLPKNTTAVALGMGLGRDETAKKDAQERLTELAKLNVPCVLDADIFYMESLPNFLEENCDKKQIVLTPHPKEFLSLLKICGLLSENAPEATSAKSPEATLSNAPDVNYVIKNRETLSAAFCKKYPGVVLIVKGASPLISTVKDGKIQQFVNPLGKNCLAKGGSGDVLSGFICALLAQGYSALKAALQGSLAHSLASDRIRTDYGMTPFMLIDEARYL
ncbi:MAG: NAD(P)H-hydrate dehydratase [Treponemataceae bacterium]|nr:NAD(P)H-hydrate dehydratase [Treponemataceae bacterium]